MADVPFNVLMKQAAALKTSQLAVDRTKFDSWDSWYQHSLFAKEDVRDVRRGQNFNQIMEFARECKKSGNDFYKEVNFDGAINQYERCLSMFDWVEPTDPDWKNKGIQDKLLEQKHFPPDDNNLSLDDVEEIQELKLTCLLNLSMCYWKTSAWANCIRASTRALEIDPRNTKALYRRAQARIIPAYCGTTENMMALEDLKKAVSIKPDDSLLTTAYAELKISLSEQKKKDKKTFNNLFERSVATPETDPSTSAAKDSPSSGGGPVSSSSTNKGKEGERSLTWQDAFNVVKDMESAALQCERDGQRAQAATIRAKKAELEKQMKQYFPAHLQTAAFPSSDTAPTASGEMSTSRNTSFGANSVSSSDSGDSGAPPGVMGITSPSSSSAGKKGKKHTNGSNPGPSPNTTSARSSPVSTHAPTTTTTTTTSSSSHNKSKVITAAGGERSSAWFDAYGNDQDFVDFGNPTPEMILDAQSRGLDLTDPRVQQLMQEINKVRLKNTRMEGRLGGRGGGNGKGLAAEGPEVTSERMEAYMQEALENMHSEEANRITSALVADVAVPALRKMLRTRQDFLLKQRAQEEEERRGGGEESVSGQYASKMADAVMKTHTNSTFRRSSRASSKPQYIPIPTTVAKLTSSSSATSSADKAYSRDRNRDGDTVFDVELDPLTCEAEELRAALQAMMVADIVQLRKDLGKEELEAQRHSDTNPSSTTTTLATSSTAIAKNKPPRKMSVLPPPKTPLTEGLTPQEAEEEAQRLSLSERIVDMLEERYGTAMHSGATAEGAGTNALLRNATVMAGIACVLLMVLHLCIRLYIAHQQNLEASNADMGAFHKRR